MFRSQVEGILRLIIFACQRLRRRARKMGEADLPRLIRRVCAVHQLTTVAKLQGAAGFDGPGVETSPVGVRRFGSRAVNSGIGVHIPRKPGSPGAHILAAARQAAQSHGYNGLNFRDLADNVGIRAASIYHHFPSKADLAAAVAKRYWEDSAAFLEALLVESSDPVSALRRYPETFRWALENDNRMCLCSFMAAEYDDLPEPVKKEVQIFADVNVAWLTKVLSAANVASFEENERRARAIFAAVAGAQLMARSRSDISLYDTLIESYRVVGLLPGAVNLGFGVD